MSEEEKTIRTRVDAWPDAALSALGILSMIVPTVNDHRRHAVLLMVIVFAGMGALRLWIPERP